MLPNQTGALRLAGAVFAKYMRRFALSVMHSDETAAAVNIVGVSGDVVDVNAGRPVPHGGDKGPWGWYPIQAYMFETGARHPVYGERKWMAQPHRPILDKTAEAGGEQALTVYAGARIREMAAEFGYH